MEKEPGRPFSDVLILTQYYSPESGAPQVRLANFARELRRVGVSVRILTAMPNYPVGRIFDGYRGRLRQTEMVEGIPVERIWLYAASGRSSWKRLLNYLSFSVAVLPFLILRPKPDLVFVEAQPLSLAFPALLLRWLRGVPYVYNAPDLQVEIAAENNWIRSDRTLRLARAIERVLMRQAVSVCTVTHRFIDHFEKQRGVPRGRISFLPNGADVDVLRPLPQDRAFASAMQTGDRKVFTYAGTHAHYHGLDVIVEAARRLSDRDDIVILMVGRGPERQRLMHAAAGLKNVLFRDSPFEEMPRLMSITYASLAVIRDIPAAHKMRLSKAVPPLACGVPVIYAGNGEAADLIRRAGCGVVVAPESPAALAEAIRRLADDPAQRDEMGRRGRTLVETELSWRFLVCDWVEQMSRISMGEAPLVPRPGLVE